MTKYFDTDQQGAVAFAASKRAEGFSAKVVKIYGGRGNFVSYDVEWTEKVAKPRVVRTMRERAQSAIYAIHSPRTSQATEDKAVAFLLGLADRLDQSSAKS
jgi:hypothetical protein